MRRLWPPKLVLHLLVAEWCWPRLLLPPAADTKATKIFTNGFTNWNSRWLVIKAIMILEESPIDHERRNFHEQGKPNHNDQEPNDAVEKHWRCLSTLVRTLWNIVCTFTSNAACSYITFAIKSDRETDWLIESSVPFVLCSCWVKRLSLRFLPPPRAIANENSKTKTKRIREDGIAELNK